MPSSQSQEQEEESSRCPGRWRIGATCWECMKRDPYTKCPEPSDRSKWTERSEEVFLRFMSQGGERE